MNDNISFERSDKASIMNSTTHSTFVHIDTHSSPQDVFIVFVSMCVIGTLLQTQFLYPNLPPGPKGWPVFGNTFQIKDLRTWKWFEDMSAKFGPIAWFNIKGDNILLLSDPKDAEELLAKRALNYSARKHSIYATHYRSNNKRMLLLSDGLEFRKQRAMFKLMFRPEALQAYEWRQEQQIKKLVFDMLSTPQEYALNLTRFTAGVIMGIVFGTPVEGREDDLKAILQSNKTFNLDGLPGMHLVDTFPWLDYFPNILAPWRKEAIRKHKAEAELFTRLAYDVKKRVKEGRGEDCFIARAWDAQEKSGLEDLSIAYLGGSAFEAGTFVSACVLHCFILACVNWPGFVQRAQKEMQDVLGDSAPSFADKDRLPYLFAVVKEAIRWVPVTPLAFPHMAENADSYKGFDIPAGTLVFPSVWNMHRDPNHFDDPAVFAPERFYRATEDGRLSPDISLVDGHWSFGFGRRECPGNYVAGQILWGAIAHLLWAFDFGKAKDSNGHPIGVDPEFIPWRPGVNIEPEPFPIEITVRSDRHAEYIREEWNLARQIALQRV